MSLTSEMRTAAAHNTAAGVGQVEPVSKQEPKPMLVEEFKRDYEKWRPEFLPPCVENYIAALETQCEDLRGMVKELEADLAMHMIAKDAKKRKNKP